MELPSLSQFFDLNFLLLLDIDSISFALTKGYFGCLGSHDMSCIFANRLEVVIVADQFVEQKVKLENPDKQTCQVLIMDIL